MKFFKKNKKEKSWDDIVFDNRNREYGAYYLRKNYAKFASIGLIISLVICFSLTFYFYITALGRQIQEYQDMFVFVSTPLEMSEMQQIQDILDQHRKKVSTPVKNSGFRITDSIANDSSNIAKKTPEKDDKPEKPDSVQAEEKIVEKKKDSLQTKQDTLFAVGDLPQFPGGHTAFNTYITNSLSISEDIKNNKIHGLIQITFSIDKFGNPINVKIIKSLSADLDKIVVDIIEKMPKWIPSRIYNENLNITYTIPIIL